jgi:hypothetical protein
MVSDITCTPETVIKEPVVRHIIFALRTNKVEEK